MEKALDDIKILVVDDDYSNVEVVLSILKGKTDFVYYAQNGKIGIDLAIKKQPDVIVTDWMMPVMNGIETIRKLKDQKSTKEIPIILATGSMTSSDNLKEALEAGAIDYLRKPYDIIEFQARVASAIRFKKQYDLVQKMVGQLNSLNANLDNLVKERSKKIEEQLSSMIKYAHMNSHVVRAPLARILGLLEIINLDPDLSDSDKIVSDLYKSGSELDEVIKGMNRLLENEIDSNEKN